VDHLSSCLASCCVPIRQPMRHGNCYNAEAKERCLVAIVGRTVRRRRVRHNAFYRSRNFRIFRPPGNSSANHNANISCYGPKRRLACDVMPALAGSSVRLSSAAFWAAIVPSRRTVSSRRFRAATANVCRSDLN
jgi:hypothetical protein